MPMIEAGEGYRILEPGEELRETDEVLQPDGVWGRPSWDWNDGGRPRHAALRPWRRALSASASVSQWAGWARSLVRSLFPDPDPRDEIWGFQGGTGEYVLTRVEDARDRYMRRVDDLLAARPGWGLPKRGPEDETWAKICRNSDLKGRGTRAPPLTLLGGVGGVERREVSVGYDDPSGDDVCADAVPAGIMRRPR